MSQAFLLTTMSRVISFEAVLLSGVSWQSALTIDLDEDNRSRVKKRYAA